MFTGGKSGLLSALVSNECEKSEDSRGCTKNGEGALGGAECSKRAIKLFIVSFCFAIISFNFLFSVSNEEALSQVDSNRDFFFSRDL